MIMKTKKFSDKIGSTILKNIEAKYGEAQAYRTMILLGEKKLY